VSHPKRLASSEQFSDGKYTTVLSAIPTHRLPEEVIKNARNIKYGTEHVIVTWQ
jgi:hypothetical protein